MTGAIFFHVECTAPWGFAVPSMETAGPALSPDTECLINYHLVTEGQARVQVAGEPALCVEAGDLVVLPHGHAHTVSYGAPRTLADSRPPLAEALAGWPRRVRLGEGEGPVKRIVCGFFGCERHAARLFLAGLPPAFKVGLRADDAGAWLEHSVRQMAEAAEAGGPGSAVLLARMAEVLFVHALRRYTEALPAGRTGWLAGARDPVVGAALAALHSEPRRPWSVSTPAAAAGTSRSVLAQRFARLLGEPPMRYLLGWRLQLAARQLETTDRSVLEVAADVGYESEAAFNRAFRRAFGVPPARYRRRRAGGQAGAPPME